MAFCFNYKYEICTIFRMKIHLMNTSKNCLWLEWYEQFFLLFWQLRHGGEWLPGHVIQILVECPLPTVFLHVSSPPVDGRSKLHEHFLPPSFYNRKAWSKGTNAGCWLGCLSRKGKRRGKWGLKAIPCVPVHHFPGKKTNPKTTKKETCHIWNLLCSYLIPEISYY